MTLKEYVTMMLLGAQIVIPTNHKNLTYKSSVNKRVLCQLNKAISTPNIYTLLKMTTS
jgi:hypothetical protein